MEKFRKQTHRYTYKRGSDKKGHICFVGSEQTFCGINRKKNGYNRTLTRFDPDLPLCKLCQNSLKVQLKEQYGIHDW